MIEDNQNINCKLKNKFIPKKLCNIKFALFLLCIAVVGQSMMVTGALTVSINMIERAFGYGSVQSGAIDTVYNLAFGLSAFILGYIGCNKKMRWTGYGTILIAVGCIAFIIPNFINKDAPNKTMSSILCEPAISQTSDTCIPSSTLYLAIMCIAYAIMGVGASPLHTIAINYIDEHTTEGDGGLYTGIYYAFVGIGPALTFLLSKPLLEIPVNLKTATNTFLTPLSENWVGAYWIIYLIGAVILLLVSVPLVLFPSKLSKRRIANKVVIKSDSFDSDAGYSQINKTKSFKSFLQSSRILITNYPYILVNIGMFFEGIMSNAVATFLAKYIEAQFSVTSGNASLFAGILVVLGATSGLLLGGILIKRYNWTVQPLILRISIVSFVGALSFLFFLFNCPSSAILGVDIDKASVSGFTSQCSIDCQCDITHYMPVCIDKQMTYYSACAAGCAKKSGNLGSLSFTECSCIPNYNINNTTVTEGSCTNSCNNLIWFMVFGFLVMILSFIIYIPLITFTMRIVGDALCLYALGLQQIILRLSFIIGPLIYGLLIDSSCSLLKPLENCQTTSNCLRYDLPKFSMYMLVASIACKGISAVFNLLAFIVLKRQNINQSNNKLTVY